MLLFPENRKLIGVWLAGWCWVFNVKISKVFYVLAAGTLGVICWPAPISSPRQYLRVVVELPIWKKIQALIFPWISCEWWGCKNENWFLYISGRAPYFKQIMYIVVNLYTYIYTYIMYHYMSAYVVGFFVSFDFVPVVLIHRVAASMLGAKVPPPSTAWSTSERNLHNLTMTRIWHAEKWIWR